MFPSSWVPDFRLTRALWVPFLIGWCRELSLQIFSSRDDLGLQPVWSLSHIFLPEWRVSFFLLLSCFSLLPWTWTWTWGSRSWQCFFVFALRCVGIKTFWRETSSLGHLFEQWFFSHCNLACCCQLWNFMVRFICHFNLDFRFPSVFLLGPTALSPPVPLVWGAMPGLTQPS